MPRPPSKHPTELELEILKILWDRGPLPARDVREALAQAPGPRDPALSSVITILNIMVDKGYLRRTRRGKAFIFRPAVTRRAVSGGMLADLLDRAFAGSAAQLMASLFTTRRPTAGQIAHLEQLLTDLKRR